MIRSRLTRRIEEKTKKNLALNILGIILIILLVFKFGIPMLVNLSFFLSGLNSQNKELITIQNQTFIAPPILDSFPQATSSSKIIISGIASKNQKINLYINGNLTDTISAENDGTFIFKETIKPGENSINAKVIINQKESEFSNTITTALKSAPPSLNINNPSDNSSFSKDGNIADVNGTTDPDVKVTINGLWAITDSNGNFQYNLPLQNGENKIKIIATDMAGNKSEKEIKVTYSP